MNAYKEDNSYCYFHPKEVVVGVCSLCLNERLLILAAKQRTLNNSSARCQDDTRYRRTPIHLPKIFAFGSFLNRLEFRHWKSDYNSFDLDHDHDAASTSQDQEDSFISIKFEDNGVASWEKGTTASTKVSVEKYSSSKAKSWNQNLNKEAKQGAGKLDSNQNTKGETMSVIEHPKPHHHPSLMRWRKKIGHLFQLVRWKRSNKGHVCHVGTKGDGVKVRKGWMRTLTKRRTKE